MACRDADPDARAQEKSRLLTYILHPIPHSQWVHVRKKIKESAKGNLPTERSEQDVSLPASASTTPDASRNPSMENIVEDEGLLLDACREVRAKLYLGQVRRPVRAFCFARSLRVLDGRFSWVGFGGSLSCT